MPGPIVRGSGPAIADITSTIQGRVGVENLAINTGRGRANPIAIADQGRKIAKAD